jgi:acyl carrier protein
MPEPTLDVLKTVVADVCGLEHAALRPDANAIDDLGIDSIDMLDIMYELNRRLKIKIPAEQWAEHISSGAANTADYFVLKRFAEHLDALVAQSRSATG